MHLLSFFNKCIELWINLKNIKKLIFFTQFYIKVIISMENTKLLKVQLSAFCGE